jgi:hypothetical protein
MRGEDRDARRAEDPPLASMAGGKMRCKDCWGASICEHGLRNLDVRRAEEPPFASTEAFNRDARRAEEPPFASTGD